MPAFDSDGNPVPTSFDSTGHPLFDPLPEVTNISGGPANLDPNSLQYYGVPNANGQPVRFRSQDGTKVGFGCLSSIFITGDTCTVAFAQWLGKPVASQL
jgi:hypothetical protein